MCLRTCDTIGIPSFQCDEDIVCQAGCECDEGWVKFNDQCIRAELCPCYDPVNKIWGQVRL